MSVCLDLVGEFLVELFGDRVVQLPMETPRRNPDSVHHLHQHEHPQPQPEPDPNREPADDLKLTHKQHLSATDLCISHCLSVGYVRDVVLIWFLCHITSQSSRSSGSPCVCADRCYPAAPVYTFTLLIIYNHS